ncbi:beta strand repeat-containing protein [Roseicyclus mahoneyensis]|uniref:Uncharacterized protein n=1 Tax=Roseicyclus mahoneyensis TaxID=164332 RepID=A0A316G2G0_9RHOB|nr:hypothetical protein [Roseicyclus mahoneyensis]PWK55121.1 hypothetical protein C7455_1196 [Roseicyclus mahoneyensis]
MAKKIENVAMFVVCEADELKFASYAVEGAVRVAPVYLDGECLEGVYSEVKTGSIDGMISGVTLSGERAEVPAGIEARNSVLKKWSEAAKKASKAQKAGMSSIMLLSLAACGGGGGSAVEVTTSTITQTGDVVRISNASSGAVISVADLTNGPDILSNVTVTATGSGTLTFDFAHVEDSVVLSANSTFSGFTTIAVQGGTVDFTALPTGALSGIRIIEINSGAILTFDQFTQLNSVTGGNSSELTVIVETVEQALIVHGSQKVNVNDLSITTDVPLADITVAQAASLVGTGVFDGEFTIKDTATAILNAGDAVIGAASDIVVTGTEFTQEQVDALGLIGATFADEFTVFGQIFVLTDSSDFLVGGDGNDIFIGRAGLDNDNPSASATGDDVLDGGAGYNTLRVSLYKSDDDPGLLPQTTNIQRLEVTTNYDDLWSVAGMDGLEVIALINTLPRTNTRSAEFEGFSALVDAELNNTNQELELRYSAGLASGDADETTLTLSAARGNDFYGFAGAQFRVDLQNGEAIETLNVVSTGPIDNVVRITGNASYETLNFSGGRDLLVEGFDNQNTVTTITTSGAAVDLTDAALDFSSLEVIDASNSTGGLSVFSSSSLLETIAGGAGDDDFELTDAVAVAEIHMGEGDNRLVIGNIDTAAGILGTTVTAGSGDDTIELGNNFSFAEGFLTVDAGAGDNTVRANAVGDVTVTTLDGDDTIGVTSSADVVINAGAGVNDIDVFALGDVDVTTLEDNDDINVQADGNVVINAGAGDNRVIAVSVDSNVDITTLDGDDVINAFAGEGGNDVARQITVDAGGGNNIVIAVSGDPDADILFDADVTVTTGSGNDSILAATSGGDVVVTSAGGDNYVAAATDATVTVTTGEGDDHVDVTWASLTAEGSAVALGDGTNTLGILDGTAEQLLDVIGFGEDDLAVTSDETWLNAFDAAELPVTGTVDRLELLNAFDLNGSVDLDVSGFEGDVSEIFFGDVDSSAGEDSQIDFTIQGMAADALIQSGDHFDLDASNGENAGRLTVEGATSITIEASVAHSSGEDAPTVVSDRAGTWTDGTFTVADGFNDNDGSVRFNLGVGNATLTSLNVAAGGQINVFLSDNDDTVAFNVGSINLYSDTSDAELSIGDNVGTTIDIGSVNIESAGDADMDIRSNAGSTITVGDVSLLSNSSDAEMNVDNGAVSDGSVTNISVGNVTVVAAGDADFEIDNNKAINGTTVNIVMGNVDVDAGSDADLEIDDNEAVNLSTMAIEVGNVELTTSGSDGDAIFDITDSLSSARSNLEIVVGNVTMSADGSDAEAVFQIDHNEADMNSQMDITVGNVVASAGDDAEFDIEDNDARNGSVVSINVGDVTLTSATEDAELEIDNNGATDNSIMDITVGNVVASAGDDADFDIDFNDARDESTVNIEVGSVTLISTLDEAEFKIGQNGASDGSEMNITVGAVSLSGSDADFRILGNDASDDSSVTINVAMAEGEMVNIAADGNVFFEISDNDANGSFGDISTLEINVSDVTITAGSDAVFTINTNNTNDADVFGSDSSATVTINVGEVTIGTSDDAIGGSAVFSVSDNSAFAQVGSFGSDADATVNITVGAVAMNAVSNVDFSIVDNDASAFGRAAEATVNITVDTIDIVSGSDVDFDIVNNSVFGEDSDVFVTTGNISIAAGNDVDFFVDGEDSTEVTLGETVTITAGLDVVGANNVSSLVDIFMNDVSGANVVTVTANSNGTGSGDIFGIFDDTTEMHTLNVSGTNAELYFFDTMGSDDDGNFTLDLSGMTGSFGAGGAEAYNPEGTFGFAGDIDDGTYVVNVGAVFAGAVFVRVGTGDLIYNAQSSSFGPNGSNDADWYYDGVNASSDWFGEEGWFSLGNGLDLEPVARIQTITPFDDTTSNDENNTISFTTVSGQTYGVREIDVISGSDVDFEVQWAKFDGTHFGPWNETYNSTIASEMGVSSVNWFGSGNIVIVGQADGSSFDQVIQATQIVDDSSPVDINLNLNITSGDRPDDGQGNDASEVFQFVGDDIGEVVIGGFNANAIRVDTNGIDYLDFSAYAGVNQLSDLVFFTDETSLALGDDGYFNDVIITSSAFDGSIRLVGLAEYDGWQAALNSSIIFD